MIPKITNERVFRNSILLSLLAHFILFLAILTSPSLPKPPKKGTTYYVSLNFGGLPGSRGGPGGGFQGGEKAPEPKAEAKKETLRDLTTAQKVEKPAESTSRYPGEKPQKDKKTKQEKKAAITVPQKEALQKIQEQVEGKSGTGSGQGIGSGLRVGIGTGSGEGGGSGYASQIGLSNFPFTYYLQILMDRVSANWFTSLVDPGISGNFQVVVYFRIFRDGQISDLKIEHSSGINTLDKSALRAIYASVPFPPLPREYENEYLGVHLIFEHSK